MDFKQIQELIRMINKSNIGELIIEEKGFKVTIKQKQDAVHQVISAPPTTIYSQPPAQLAHPNPAVATNEDKPKSAPATAELPSSTLLTIKSPMIGTFYR